MSNRVRRCLRKLIYQPAIVVAAFKHYHWASIATRLEVENQAGVCGPWMFGYKRLRAQQTWLFSISEKKNDVVLQRLAGFESAQSFKQSCDGRTVIAGAKTSFDRVVMSHQ